MDEEWVPKTELGRLVANGQINTIGEALHTKLPLKEYQIVDYLVPDLKDEIINIERAQRMTDSGRRMNYSITAVVGNGNGYVGIGMGKAKEAAPAIRKAINNAKTNIIEIKGDVAHGNVVAEGHTHYHFTLLENPDRLQ